MQTNKPHLTARRTTWVSGETHRKLRVAAAYRDVPISYMAEEILSEALAHIELPPDEGKPTS